jgi:Putative amidase domain
MSSEWSGRNVYRARRTRRRRRRLLVVAAVLGVAAIGVTVAHGERGGGGRVVFDRAAVAAYADRWALSHNPAYWRSPNRDCANFVSQCVAAGGFGPADGPTGDWRDGGRTSPSVAWVNCQAQWLVWSRPTAEASSPYIESTTTTMPADWAVGDVVYLGDTTNGAPEWQHVIICVGKRGGQWVYDSHTVAHRRQPLATWYPTHFSLIRYCHLADGVSYR